MSTTVMLHDDGPEITLHAGSTYVVKFKKALHMERFVGKFMEEIADRLLFSLRPLAGTTPIDLVDIISIEPALKGAQSELPTRVPWESS